MHFIPHFYLTWFKNTFSLRDVDFPNAKRMYETTMTLPFYPGMTNEDAEYVADTVLKVIAQSRV